MIMGISRRRLGQRLKICWKVLLLAAIVFYLLPELIAMYRQFEQPGPKLRDEQYWEKPLRVISVNMNNFLVYEKNFKKIVILTGKERKTDF
jgi:hypothetical protein